MINRSMKNDAILAEMPQIKTLLDEGKVVLIDKVATSNPEYTNLYFMANVSGIGAPAGDAEALLLGWDKNSMTTMRCIQNAKTEIANNFNIGTALPGDFTLRVYDVNAPEYKGHNQRRDRDGNLLFADGNKPIYRNSKLVSRQEFDMQGHDIQGVTHRSSAPVVSNAILQGTTA